MATLLGINQRLKELEAAIEIACIESDGEITDEVQALMDDYLEAEFGVSEKFDQYGYAIRRQQAEIDILEERIAALRDRRDAGIRAHDKMKERLFTFMKGNDIQRVQGEIFNFSVRRAGGKVPVLLDRNVTAADLDERFVRVKYEVDKSALHAALSAGEEVKHARLGPRSEYVHIT